MQGLWINITTHGFEALDKLLRTLVIFQVFHHEHNEVIIIQLSEVFGHEAFDQWFQFPVDHTLVLRQYPRDP